MPIQALTLNELAATRPGNLITGDNQITPIAPTVSPNIAVSNAVNPASTSTVIPVTTLTPSVPITLATPPVDTNNHGAIISAIANTTQNQQNTDLAAANLAQTNQENTNTANQKSILDLMKQENQKIQDTQTALDTSGATDLSKKLNDLNAQIQNVNLEAQTANQTLESNAGGKNITTAFLGRQEQEVNRQAAIKSLTLSAQYNVLKGNYDIAKENAQRAIDLKYLPIENEIAIQKQQYEYNKDLLTSIDKKRTEALDAKIKKDEQDLADKKAILKTNVDKASEYAKYAMEGGQSDLASQISSLDPASITFTKDLANLQAKIKNPIMALDLAIKQADLAYKLKQTKLLGEPTATEKKATAEAIKNAKTSLPVMQDKITLIDALKTHPGMAVRVGPNPLARDYVGLFGNVSTSPGDITGAGQNFAESVHNLTNGLTLQNLIDAKANGATFGALSEGELNLLASSATKLNGWELKDSKGIGKGIWNIDEDSFKKELDNIKMLTQRAINQSSGKLLSSDEENILNNTFNTQTNNPADYYNQ